MIPHSPVLELQVRRDPRRFALRPLDRRRVILAEDDFELRSILADILSEAGYDVTECSSGDELWEQIDGADLQPVAAIVSDHHMPVGRREGLGGLGVLERLQVHEQRAPFILITGYGGHELRQRALALGADLVLDKPLDQEELLEAIRDLSLASNRT